MLTLLRRHKIPLFLVVFSLFLALEVAYFSLKNEFDSRLPWGIQIANADYGLLEAVEVEQILTDRIQAFLAEPLRFQVGDSTHEFTAVDLGLEISASKAVNLAAVELVTFRDRSLSVELDTDRLRELLLAVDPTLELTPVNARAVLTESGELAIEPETAGRMTDFAALAGELRARAGSLDHSPILVASRVIEPAFAAADLTPFRPQLTELIRLPLVLKDTEYRRFDVNLADRLGWFEFGTRYLLAGLEVSLPGTDRFTFLEGEAALTLRSEEFIRFVEQELSPLVEVDSQTVAITQSPDGVISFDGVARHGRRVDIVQLRELILAAVAGESREVMIPYLTQAAPVQVSSDLVELGITELIGEAVTDYAGSPTNRQYNIRLGAEKLDGRLIAPGEEFSFIEALGPITSGAGFRNEMVIKEGDVIPEIGGGVCQISTTFFRTALATGLPITEQRPHSLKVRHYTPPGLDATIYPGQADLKFVNNTGGHILIQTAVEDTRLQVNFFGTGDGRQARLAGPFYLNGQPITDLRQAGMKMYWQRFLTQLDGSEVVERYDAAYSYLPRKE